MSVTVMTLGYFSMLLERCLFGVVVLLPLICRGLHDFRDDYAVKESELSDSYRKYINDERKRTEDMPRVCRKGEWWIQRLVYLILRWHLVCKEFNFAN